MLAVDKIVTISLKDNYQRRLLAEVELEKLQLETIYCLIDRDYGHEERGCFNSHIEVCRQALAENLDLILVCEDDVRIRHFHPKQINRINEFVKKNQHKFDIFYLGLIIGKMWFTRYPSIVGTKGAGLHAYILSRRGMKKMALYQYVGTPIDKVVKHDFKCYSIYPIIADQFPETIVGSDISLVRSGISIKTEEFWRKNFTKQKWILLKNLHKSIKEFLF